MFEGMGFLGLLGINMAAAGVIAAAGDSVTQRMEMHFRRPPAKRARRRRRRTSASTAASGGAEPLSPETGPVQNRRASIVDELELPNVCGGDEELEFWPEEVPDRMRFYPGGQVVALRHIDLQMFDGSSDGTVEEGIKGRVVSVPGDTEDSVAQVGFMVDGEEVVFDAMEGDVELDLQKHDCWRTLRMVCVGALVFDPLSFTWYYTVLPRIVPGHGSTLTAWQMTKKILWDTVLYGGFVAAVSISANAGLQACSAEIQQENEKRGVTRCDHVCFRVKHDLPRLYIYGIMLSIPADIPVFLFVPAKWQAAAFKFGDALFMLIVSYVINQRVSDGAVEHAPRLQRNRVAMRSKEPAPAPPPPCQGAPEEEGS